MAATDGDVEAIVVDFLTQRFPAPIRVVTVLPANITGDVVQVGVLAGGASTLTLLRSVVDVDCYSPSGRIAARQLAYRVWVELTLKHGEFIRNSASMSRVDTINAPAWRPYDDSNVQRVGITVQATVHAPTLAST